MSLIILKPGLLDTVQDLGRYGYGSLGINPGGAMDGFAAQVGNLLVGNCANGPVLEMHFPGPQIMFEQTCMISLTGANFTALIDEVAIPRWQPIVVRRNTVLHFEQLQSGARCYLAVHGGFRADRWLGSSSTNLKAGAGGFRGRRLEKTDRLYLGENNRYFAGWLPEGRDFAVLPWHPNIQNVYEFPREVDIIPGHEWDQLTEASKADFIENNFTIHPRSDRMGYHLKGPALELQNRLEMLSSGVQYGTLQLMPDGQMILLMADHQTTGGYPRIGHVIAAHWPRLAQLAPSDSLHFNFTTMAEAEKKWFSYCRDLRVLQRSCTEKLNQLVC